MSKIDNNKSQLILPIERVFTPQFDNYIDGDNHNAKECVKQNSEHIWLWGEIGTGKSHLLQAAVNQASLNNITALYISVTEPVILRNEYQLVALDNIDSIAGVADEELFHLFNHLNSSGTRMIFSASQPPNNSGFVLPDLISRLSSCTVFHLKELSDNNKEQMIITHAKKLSLEITEKETHYLIQRVPRDIGSIINLIDRVAHQSLVEKRKVTIPFLKEIINKSS